MCDRNVKAEYILIKLSALVFECICERTSKFHEKMLFDSGVINLQVGLPMTNISVSYIAKIVRIKINMVFSADCRVLIKLIKFN